MHGDPPGRQQHTQQLVLQRPVALPSIGPGIAEADIDVLIGLQTVMLSGSFNPIRGEHRVLLVTADESYRDDLGSILEANGFRVESVLRMSEAQRHAALLRPRLILVHVDSSFGPEAAEQCRGLLGFCSARAAIPLIVLTDAEWFESAVELVKDGAVDFLIKPFPAEELLRRMAVALHVSSHRIAAANAEAGDAAADFSGPWKQKQSRTDPTLPERAEIPLAESFPTDFIIGRSQAIQRVIEQVRLVAPKKTTILITGETGTGKERIARAIHALSRRRDRPMVSVNCGGIPANLLEDEFFGHVKGAFTDAYQARVGRFEQAHRSTLFLDEIGDLPLELQPKLLRVLQEREVHRIGGVDPVHVDARVIAATNVDLWNKVRDGGFREDLFYRINVFPVHLPPLRERREDIPLFVSFFLRRFCQRDGLGPKQLSASAEASLVSRRWPGNIRELENAVEIAVIRSQERSVIEAEDFPEPRDPLALVGQNSDYQREPSAGLKQIVGQFERHLISRILARTKGNKTQAAELLGLKRTTLIEKLKKFDPEWQHIPES